MDSLLSEESVPEVIQKTYLIVFFLIGLFNNLGYAMVFTGAHNLVYNLRAENSIGLVIISLVSCELLILLLNLRFFIGYANKKRILVCCALSSIAYAGISYSIYRENKTLIYAMLAFATIGITSSLGECVNLGMLKEFLPKYLIGFSSGTGSSRLMASGLWVLIRAFYHEDDVIWASLIISSLVYFTLFCFMQTKIKIGAIGNRNLELTVFVINKDVPDCISTDTGNAYYSSSQLKIIFRKAKVLALTLAFSYFFEAILSIGLADRISLKIEKSSKKNIVTENLYEFIQFFYYTGVMIGKFCISVIKTKKLWVVVLLQFGNCVIWVLEYQFEFIGYWGDLIIGFWIGLLGGICYANVFFQVLNLEEIPKYYKEATTNFILGISTFFILIASILITLLDNYEFQA